MSTVSYSTALRKRVIDYVARGHSPKVSRSAILHPYNNGRHLKGGSKGKVGKQACKNLSIGIQILL